MTEWMDQAACAEVDGAIWFPETAGAAVPAYKTAAQVCTTCPVQPDCLEYALKIRPGYGMWAGLRPDQLRELFPKVDSAGERREQSIALLAKVSRLRAQSWTTADIARDLGVTVEAMDRRIARAREWAA